MRSHGNEQNLARLRPVSNEVKGRVRYGTQMHYIFPYFRKRACDNIMSNIDCKLLVNSSNLVTYITLLAKVFQNVCAQSPNVTYVSHTVTIVNCGQVEFFFFLYLHP